MFDRALNTCFVRSAAWFKEWKDSCGLLKKKNIILALKI